MSAKIKAITLPKMGLTMEQGSVSAWHVEPGSTVNIGDEIADIETEKVTIAYESPVSGLWRDGIATIGDELPVGALIGVIADADVSEAEIDQFIADFQPSEPNSTN